MVTNNNEGRRAGDRGRINPDVLEVASVIASMSRVKLKIWIGIVTATLWCGALTWAVAANTRELDHKADAGVIAAQYAALKESVNRIEAYQQRQTEAAIKAAADVAAQRNAR